MAPLHLTAAGPSQLLPPPPPARPKTEQVSGHHSLFPWRGWGEGGEEFEEETAVAREFGKCIQLLGALGRCRRELAGGEGGHTVLGGHDGRGSRGLRQEKGTLPVRESRGQQLFPSVSLPPPSSISSKTCDPTLVGHRIAALAVPTACTVWPEPDDGGSGRGGLRSQGWAPLAASATGFLLPLALQFGPSVGAPRGRGAEATVWWVWPLGTLRNSSCPCCLEPADRFAQPPGLSRP